MIKVHYIGENEGKQESAKTLESFYFKIAQNQHFPLSSKFQYCHKKNWFQKIAKTLPALLYYEISSDNLEQEISTIQAIQAHNRGLIWVLLGKKNLDYLTVADRCGIGNILVDNQFDFDLIQHLTIRLMTGNIFGLGPYFNDNYLIEPTEVKIEGQVIIKDIVDHFENQYLSKLLPDIQFRIKTYFYELLVNTIAYTVLDITAKERDAGQYKFPSETYISPEKTFSYTIASDSEKCALCIRDSSGTLTRNRILGKVRRQYVFGQEKHPPGILDFTGRGLFLLLRDNQLMANIYAHCWTEIVFLHYYDKSKNKFESLFITQIGN